MTLYATLHYTAESGNCELGAPCSQSSVELSEIVGKIERHDQDPRTEGEHMRRFAQIEVADTSDEQVADGKVEKAP
jgi:hypothetical protein